MNRYDRHCSNKCARVISSKRTSMQRIAVVALMALMFVALATETRAQSEHPSECPRNSTWSICGRLCELLCAHPEGPACIADCISSGRGGCTCDAGFYRKDNGDCVREQDC